ncbi:hypothetical protein ACFPM1_03730 [Halorubrum rubrum]|uniref:N-acetyltransferase domain-containing protein n=1 Tax=Halorubrum rubrum TaxID=1126240 RepID=A0ABD5QZ57_9EURY|nr:hypothetical protein [Halorubrum rubrum]
MSADAAAGGREALDLSVTVDNKAARHVYHAHGFETVERDGDIHMALSLADPIATEVAGRRSSATDRPTLRATAPGTTLRFPDHNG